MGSNYGTITLDINGCAIWTPNGTQPVDDTVTTCVTTCNGSVCDTIYVIILPPTGPLPVTLLSFNGEMADCHTQLSWQTVDETNKDFVIERMAPGW